ncbi:hypothetical protein [Paenibacillus sp. OAS669]|uniref:hypothetical protein n=1 Tax=Paenibacillus sp. OAS669 TaxID=2663821 RepID=UPI00178AC917|nr:hypothetical protein [Paenibacillus sp. OAS669]MBE1446164.1 hypothetical protein [Paenibacillus sp. OAS669]
MFDTVQLRARFIDLDSHYLNQHNPKSFTSYNSSTGELRTTYKVYDELLPYITYYDGSHMLDVQVSIPKLLFGNNVQQVTETDIPVFFDRLQERLEQLFFVKIPHSSWTVIRCDVSWNFQVGNEVPKYVRLLSKQKFAFKSTITYNQDQTVEYRNKSSRIIFYDKEAQLTKMKEPDYIIEQSRGLLRLEIKPSTNDMKKFSPTRLAVELIGKPFFEYMTGKVLGEIEYPPEFDELDLSWLLENRVNIAQIERMLGFQRLQEMFDEQTLRKIYTSSTYANRKTEAKKMTIPRGNCLSPLTISQ